MYTDNDAERAPVQLLSLGRELSDQVQLIAVSLAPKNHPNPLGYTLRNKLSCLRFIVGNLLNKKIAQQ